MKTKVLLLAVLLSGISISCNETAKSDKSEKSKEKNTETVQAQISAETYEMLKTNCFNCHFEKPSPANKDKMIAPPMLRMQEHYKPAYSKKEDFVKAVVDYVNNPSEDKTMMPGTVKKFGLMPKLVFNQDDLQKMAEALYDIDFGKFDKKLLGHKNTKLSADKKVKLSKKAMQQIAQMITKIKTFKSNDITAYNQLGKDIFNLSKNIMLDKSYSKETFDQIHNFFQSSEDDMHKLMEVKSVDKAKELLVGLQEKLKTYNQYFE